MKSESSDPTVIFNKCVATLQVEDAKVTGRCNDGASMVCNSAHVGRCE